MNVRQGLDPEDPDAAIDWALPPNLKLKAALAGYDAQYSARGIGEQHPQLPRGCVERVEALVREARAIVDSGADISSTPVYAANCRHYEGRSPASCSFRIYGCPNPEMPGGTIIAEGTGLTTEEVHQALLDEARRWATGNGTVVKMTEGPFVSVNPQPTERPYASALGFYAGDRIELFTRDARRGWVDHVKDGNHTVIVRLDDGHRVYASDQNLTRLADD